MKEKLLSLLLDLMPQEIKHQNVEMDYIIDECFNPSPP